MGATTEFIFFGLSSLPMGEQHTQGGTIMHAGRAACLGGAARPGEQHAMGEQHAHCPGGTHAWRSNMLWGITPHLDGKWLASPLIVDVGESEILRINDMGVTFELRARNNLIFEFMENCYVEPFNATHPGYTAPP